MGLWVKQVNNILNDIRKSIASRLREVILLFYSAEYLSAVSSAELSCLNIFLHSCSTSKQWQQTPSFQNPIIFQREPEQFMKVIMSCGTHVIRELVLVNQEDSPSPMFVLVF